MVIIVVAVEGWRSCKGGNVDKYEHVVLVDERWELERDCDVELFGGTGG